MAQRNSLRRSLGSLAALVLIAGCDGTEPLELDTVEVTTDEAAVIFAAASPTTRVELGAELSALADDDGVPVGAIQAGLVSIEGDSANPVAVVASGDEPSSVGAVYAIAPRASGLLISSESGLFHTWAGVLLPSPASDALRGASALAVADGDEGEIVYAALSDGLHRLDAMTHERIELGFGAPTALAATRDAVLLAFGERLVELDPNTLAYREVPADIGVVTAAAAAGQRLVAGGSDGLVIREGDGRYLVYPALAGVIDITTDSAGVAHALVSEGVVRLDPAGPIGLSALPESSAAWVGLALDTAGYVWLGETEALTRLDTGRPVSFADDVAPILALRCAPCHALGELAPKRDFTDYDIVIALSDAIMTRVSTRLMPPPPNPGLDAEEYEILVRWYAGERAP